MRVRAPRPALTPPGVTQVVVSASKRAGLGEVTPHRLRHTAASELLRRGAPLVEIGQLLRHRTELTTDDLRQGRPGSSAGAGAAVAGRCVMSPLHDTLADYLQIRRALGYKLERAGKLLPQYLDYLDDRGERLVTIENALAWATLPAGDANWWAFRISVVRGFASYLHALDPVHEVPPTDLLPRQARRMTPYLYSEQEIRALMAATSR